MNRFEWLAGITGGDLGAELLRRPEAVTELRIRVGQRMLLRKTDGDSFHGETVTGEKMQEILQKLTEGSFYAHEKEMAEGYFSIPGGFRAGVCGKLVLRAGQPAQMANVSSLCIRIPHEIRGCADALAAKALADAGIAAVHEARLAPRCRIDFLAGGIGIEIKKSRPERAKLLAQIERYAACPQVAQLVVVAPRGVNLPETVGGKRVVMLALERLWGICLP